MYEVTPEFNLHIRRPNHDISISRSNNQSANVCLFR